MAQQKGIIKLKGTIGDITFYHSKDGYLAKAKTSLDGTRIATDPNFARTRENGREFGEAATDGKLLRTSIRSFMKGAHDNRVTSRLTKLLTKIVKLDTTSLRGFRTIGIAIAFPNAMTMLKGFNFNIKSLLSDVLKNAYALNSTTGVITINNFTPINDIVPPQGATHVTLIGAWAKVDFSGRVYNMQTTNAVNLLIDGTSSTVTLTPTATPTGTGTNVYLLKVEFFQLVNAVQYTLNNGAYNALSIIQVA